MPRFFNIGSLTLVCITIHTPIMSYPMQITQYIVIYASIKITMATDKQNTPLLQLSTGCTKKQK